MGEEARWLIFFLFFFPSVISRDASDPKNEEFMSIQRESVCDAELP